MLFLPASVLLAVASVILFVQAFEFMDEQKKHQIVAGLYRRLPRRITSTRKFQDLHYRVLYDFNRIMYWSRCFPTEQCHWINMVEYIRCRDCGKFHTKEELFSNNLAPSQFEQAEDVFLAVV